MVLTIDTTLNDYMQISLIGGDKKIVKKVKAPRLQTEKLLPLLVKMMAAKGISWKDIKEVRVQNQGASFTSLRVGVLTANALAYALKIPARALVDGEVFAFPGGQAVKPHYASEPNIGKPRASAC